MLVIALIGCGVLLFGGILAARSRMGYGGVCLVAVMGFFAQVLIMTVVPPVAINAVLLFVIGVGCAVENVRHRNFAILSSVATVVALGWSSSLAMQELDRHKELQAKYPLESISERLAYESRQRAEETSDEGSTTLDEKAVNRLEQLEEYARERNWTRTSALSTLHANSVDTFVK